MIRLFRVSIPVSVLTLVVCDTILLFGLYVVGTYLGWRDDPEFYLVDNGGLWRIAVVVLIIQIGLYFQDSYDELRSQGHIVALVQQMCIVVGGTFLIQALFSYGIPALELNKWGMVYGSGLTVLIIPLWRRAFSIIVRRALPAERVLFIGSSPILRQIGDRLLQRPEMGLSVIGYIDDQLGGGPNHGNVSNQENDTSPGDFPAPHLGCLSDLARIAREANPGRIVVGMTERRGRLPMEQLMDLRFSGIHIEEAATLYESVLGRISAVDLRPSQLVFSAEFGPRARNVYIQNIYSVLLGFIGLIISLPVMAIVALVVKFSSTGPILYRQTRVGLRGVPFQVLKFRSMYADAEAHTGVVWATKEDPRITPAGRWLRKLRLDELPQFFNVVRGEMAVVGPRPERPEFCRILEQKIPFYRQRHSVKPGITGWAQINHDYTDTVEDSITKLEYDLYYIKNLTPSLDAYILFHTLKVMLLSRGAR